MAEGGAPYLVVAVVGVAHDGEDVPHGEDDGGQPGGPQSNIYLVGEKMMLQHQPATGSRLLHSLGHPGDY